MQEFEDIQRYLENCRPYHRNQDKSITQRKLEKAGSFAAGIIIFFGIVVIAMAAWQIVGLHVSAILIDAVTVWVEVSPVVMIIWLLLNFAAERVGANDEKRKPEAERHRDIHLRTTTYDERNARGLTGYSYDSLIRAEHYLGCKIQNIAWITSLP